MKGWEERGKGALRREEERGDGDGVGLGEKGLFKGKFDNSDGSTKVL